MGKLPVTSDPRLLVGIETSDDAGVFVLNETTALIQTVDFFTPIVDDPYTFGQIAAANGLSDVYAMGGTPLTAMNLVAFPAPLLETGALAAILAGGQNKINEAGAFLVGGHTVDDPEPKYGLSVTGIAHPGEVWRNAGAKPQDRLILTKALGTGVLATAFRAEMFDAGWQQAVESMKTLNKAAADIARGFTVHACTDVTGFGFLGHLSEMASASQVTVRVDSRTVPLLPQAREAAHMGLVPGGSYANRAYFSQRGVAIQPGVPEAVSDLLFDPQTSGGLLLATPAEQAESLVKAMLQQGIIHAAIVGQVETTGKGEIYVD